LKYVIFLFGKTIYHQHVIAEINSFEKSKILNQISIICVTRF
jgi:hypothetical protein